MVEFLKNAADHAGDICQIATLALLLIRPIREWIFGFEALRAGQRCLLRTEIVRIYYRHREDKQLREYEFRNLEQSYKGYKALKGNSFVDRIYEEMQQWDIM